MSHSCCKLPPCNVCPWNPEDVDWQTSLGGMRRSFASSQSAPCLLSKRSACGQRRSRKLPGTMVIRAGSTEQSVPHKPLNKVFSSLPTTVFTTMTNLANESGSVNLGQGFPDDEGPDSMKQIVGAAVYDFPNQYPPALGIPELRKAVASHSERFSGLHVDWQTETVVTVGATEALASAFMGILNEGDEVIMLEPLYDSYAAMARRAGGKIVPVSLQPPNWTIPHDQLAAAFGPKTKAILVNSPHNPTGTAFSKADLEAVAELCKKHDVIAICDEVYEHLVYEGSKHISLRTLPGMAERSIRIGSAGKTFSFTAWKVGWATGPAPLIAAVAKAHSFLVFTVPSNLQRAVAHGLEHESSFYCGLSKSLQAKRDLLEGHLKTAGFSTLPAHGSYFITADIRNLANEGETDVDFCYRITKEAGVTALPVSAFYVSDAPPRNLIRFCFCKNDAKLEDAGQKLAKYFVPASRNQQATQAAVA